MNYVQNANSGYPTGENNVKTSQGRKVGLYVVVSTTTCANAWKMRVSSKHSIAISKQTIHYYK